MNSISIKNREYLPYLFLASILLLAGIIRYRLSGIPFERDEGAYAYYGLLMLEGKIPYLDFYEMKLPGIFYAYGLISYLFGSTHVDFHIGFALINLATTILMFLIGSRLFDKTSAVVIALVYAILSLNRFISGFTAQSEQLVVLLAAAGMLSMLYYISKRHARYLIACGGLFCAALFIKQSGLFFLLAAGVVVILVHFLSEKAALKMIFRDLLLLGLGAMACAGVMLLPVFIMGAADEMYYWTIDVSKHYVSNVPLAIGWKLFLSNAINIFSDYILFAVVSLAGIIGVFFLDIRSEHKAYLWVFLLFSLLTIIPGLRFYGHYWIQIMPVISIFVGACSFWIKSTFEKKQPGKEGLKTMLTMAFIAIIAVPTIYAEWNYYTDPDYKKIMHEVYGISNQFNEALILGEKLKQNTGPEDRIALIGSEPELFIYSDRKSVSRHAYFSFIVRNLPDHEKWQKEYAKDIAEGKPKYIIYFKSPLSIFAERNASLWILQWLSIYLLKHYHIAGIIDTHSADKTVFISNNEVKTYQPQGIPIYVFERNM
jgi:4-amino-4-deoxy-L-arabinose transferase-like glycosyltransferase